MPLSQRPVGDSLDEDGKRADAGAYRTQSSSMSMAIAAGLYW